MPRGFLEAGEGWGKNIQQEGGEVRRQWGEDSEENRVILTWQQSVSESKEMALSTDWLMAMTTETNSLQAKSSPLCISLFLCCTVQRCHYFCLVAVCLLFQLKCRAVVGRDEMATLIQQQLWWVTPFLPKAQSPPCPKEWWKRVNIVIDMKDHIGASGVPLVQMPSCCTVIFGLFS